MPRIVTLLCGIVLMMMDPMLVSRLSAPTLLTFRRLGVIPAIIVMLPWLQFSFLCRTLLCVILSIVKLMCGPRSITCVSPGLEVLVWTTKCRLTATLLAEATFIPCFTFPKTVVSTCVAAAPLPALAMVMTGICDWELTGNRPLTMVPVMNRGLLIAGRARTWNFGVVPILYTLLLALCMGLVTLG